MRIKEFHLNSDHQVVKKVVKEVLDLFKLELPVKVEKLPYRKSPEKQAQLLSQAPFDILELSVENTVAEVAGETTSAMTERPGYLPVVTTVVTYTGADGEKHRLERSDKGVGSERFEAGKHRLMKLNLYHLLRQEFGFPEAPWGILHGVRPTKIVHRMLNGGQDRAGVISRLKQEYAASEEKAVTIVDMAIRQQPFLEKSDRKTISIYVGIPFCITRCLYCSFPANILPGDEGIERFMVSLRKDIAAVKELVQDYGFKVQSIYIGGGTPTSLPDRYFGEMLSLVKDSFYGDDTVEFTVEAGRPDSMSEAKLQAMAQAGVTRVSCNPQTMQQRTLKRIGRQHTVEAVKDMFHDLRRAGIPEINMDMIIGLPGEGVEDVRDTMEQIVALGPDDITLHSLALKKGSRLKMHLEDYELPDDDTCREMFAVAMDYVTKAGLKPYYLYRQGYMSGQMENVGCCRDGAESMYNIQIMEEQQTILGIGGGATSKVVEYKEHRLKSAFNAKDLITYQRDIDIYIEKRRALLEETYGKPEAASFD